jgi:hypothetical protein
LKAEAARKAEASLEDEGWEMRAMAAKRAEVTPERGG